MFQNKKVLVVGMARSGISSAKLLCSLGASVIVNDRLPDLFPAIEAIGFPVENALGRDPMEFLDGLDALVLSPGVPFRQAFVDEAKRRGIDVMGEIELAYRLLKAPIAAITGTNGKTTTTTLAGEMFKASGRTTHVLGNIGVPVADMALLAKPSDIVVAEIAALQIESASTFRPAACAFLNISEDHQDRFGTMEYYIACKARILENQRSKDFCVLNADDPVVFALGRQAKGRVLYFSRAREVENGAFVKDDNIVFRLDRKIEAVCPIKDVKIPGAHNLENALAAAALCMCMGVGAGAARHALTTFEGVEHRIEFVCEIGGVRYINDSKGTNPDSTIKAIEAMTRPTVLILGGYDKHLDFMPVFNSFGKKVKEVVALGATKKQLLETASKASFSHIHSADGFESAVLTASKLAGVGDAVLLSPACASFDMFSDYEERGRCFKEIVRNLNR